MTSQNTWRRKDYLAIECQSQDRGVTRDFLRLSSIVAVEANERGVTIWTDTGKYFSYGTFNANKVIAALEENYSIARVEL